MQPAFLILITLSTAPSYMLLFPLLFVFSLVSGFSLLWTPQGLHEWICMGKKKNNRGKKLMNLTWLLNQLSPVGKVGNVVLWDSFSVSISCLHVHLILNQPNPATFIQKTPPHLAPGLAANQPSLKKTQEWSHELTLSTANYMPSLRLNKIFCMTAEDLVCIFTRCSFKCKKWERTFFPSIMLGITRFTKTLKSKWGYFFYHIKSKIAVNKTIKGFILRRKKYTLVVKMAVFCPDVGECPRVCFSLISVVLVVVYQPGKWLWWCQLTPHCHSRFVSQTHHLSHPPSQPSLTLPHLLPPPTPHLSLPSPSPFFSFCDVFGWSSVCSFCFFLVIIVHQWWWQMGFSNTDVRLKSLHLKLPSCTRSFSQFQLSIANTDQLRSIIRIYDHVKDFKTRFTLLKPASFISQQLKKNHELLLISIVLMRHFAAPFVQKK